MSKDRFTIFISHSHQDFEQLIEEALRSTDVNVIRPDGKHAPLEFKVHGPPFKVLASPAQVMMPEVEEAAPPSRANLLLRYALPKKHQDHIIGDLVEAYYTEWLPEHGPHQARRLYWWHATRSIAPMLWTGAKRSGIITFIVGAADWLRDRFS